MSLISFRKIPKEAAILAVTTTDVKWSGVSFKSGGKSYGKNTAGFPRACHETVGSMVAFLYSCVCFVLLACLFVFSIELQVGQVTALWFVSQACAPRKLEKPELRAPIVQTALSTAEDPHISLAKNSRIPVYFLFISLTPAFSLWVYYVYQLQQKKKRKKKQSD